MEENKSKLINVEKNYKLRKSSINSDGRFHFLQCKDINVSLDIGGTLTKLIILINKQVIKSNPKIVNLINSLNPNYAIEVVTGKFSYLNLNENDEIKSDFNDLNEYNDDKYDSVLVLKKSSTFLFESETLELIKSLKENCEFDKIFLTGGGSVKFNQKITDNLNVKIIKFDELQSLIKGYFIMNEYRTMYHLEQKKLETILQNFKDNKNDLDDLNYKKVNLIQEFTFPHLVVNIGSGVSIIKVISDKNIERVGGTMCGGGTLLGLSKLILGTDNFDEISELAKKGDYRNLDLLVSDIYGKSTEGKNDTINLEKDVLASSFGKVYQTLAINPNAPLNKEDIAQSLVLLISFQIAQLGFLYAKQYNIKHICYFGNFTQSGAFTIDLLNYGTKFWDKDILCHFNDLDGFLGGIGCLTTDFES